MFVQSNFELILSDVNASSPAQAAGLQSGMVLTAINGQQFSSNYAEYALKGSILGDEFNIKPGNRVAFTDIDGNIYNVVASSRPDDPTRAYIGIIFAYPEIFHNEFFINILEPMLRMAWLLSIVVGAFNLLPIGPLDGGQFFNAIVQKYARKNSKTITRYVTAITVIAVLYSLVGPFIMSAA